MRTLDFDTGVNKHIIRTCQYCKEVVEKSTRREKVTCFSCSRKHKKESRKIWGEKRNPQNFEKKNLKVKQ